MTDFKYTLRIGEDQDNLAPFALHSSSSRGCAYPEPAPSSRTIFQRDRDRVVHSKAFRRLDGKQQVFDNIDPTAVSNDHTRSRLTHTLEVAQLSRTVADALRLNAAAAEAMAFAHDLGHAPFGHAGQDELNGLVSEYGGFEHNHQSLRIVEHMERYSPDYPGLNLSYEVREGIIKHNRVSDPSSLSPEDPVRGFDPHLNCHLEGQLVNLCDEIAYNHHDLEDGVRSGILIRAQILEDFPLLNQFAHGDASPLGFKLALRGLLGYFISDLIHSSFDQIKASGVATVADVRKMDVDLMGHSSLVAEQCRQLKTYLFKALYDSPRISRRNSYNRAMLNYLFKRQFSLFTEQALAASPYEVARQTVDYISGMTDHFALHCALDFGYQPPSEYATI